MHEDIIDCLIKILLDPNAREDEKHDAAMDVGQFNNDKALKVLLEIATNFDEKDIILDASGESIAQIWVRRNQFDIEAYRKSSFICSIRN